MSLSNFPQVVIDLEHGTKFVVVTITDKKGDQKTVVRTYDLTEHFDIFQRLLQEVQENGVEMVHEEFVDAGKIFIEIDEKLMLIYGMSEMKESKSSRPKTMRLIQSEHPKFRVEEGIPATSHT